MLRLLLWVLFLIISVWAGILILRYTGYVLIVCPPWLIQMPLWTVALALVVLLFVVYLFIHGVDQLGFLWFRLKNWYKLRREHRFYNHSQHGLICLIEGQFKKAERLLTTKTPAAFDPLVNYLGAAKAAHEQEAYKRRDIYMNKAYQAAPHAKLAIQLLQAEFSLAQGQWEQATLILQRLQTMAPYHPAILKALEKVYIHRSEWEKLNTLLPALTKAKLITKVEAQAFEKNIYKNLLEKIGAHSFADLSSFWNSLPRQAKKNPEILAVYVKQLLHFNDTTQAEQLLRKALKEGYSPALIELYGHIPFTNLNKQFTIASAWLKTYGPHQELFLLLGTWCVQAQLWGKAKDYFEKGLALGPSKKISLEYGKLLEFLDDKQAALRQYRRGLENEHDST